MWEHQNSILHANTKEARLIRESPVDAQIRLLYSQQESFAATHRVLFNVPLPVRLRHSHCSRKHLIVLAHRYQETSHHCQAGDQLPITQFFNRCPATCPITSLSLFEKELDSACSQIPRNVPPSSSWQSTSDNPIFQPPAKVYSYNSIWLSLKTKFCFAPPCYISLQASSARIICRTFASLCSLTLPPRAHRCLDGQWNGVI